LVAWRGDEFFTERSGRVETLTLYEENI
jgi:hypothetical protein